MSQKSPAERIAEYKEKAVAAKMAGDLQTAADWYYKAARLADFDSASEYARIAFPHIYDPIPNEKKAAAIGAKIHKWEMGKYLKLRQELTYYGDKERAFQKALEAHDKLASKYDHPMVDELYGSLYETYCGIQGKAEAYYKKAAERGDYKAAYSLVLAYCHNSFNGSRGTVTGVQDMEQFWKYVFLVYELSKQRLAWFTHKGMVGSGYSPSSDKYQIPHYQLHLLETVAGYMCISMATDLFPEKPPAEVEAEEKPVDRMSYDYREKDYEYADLAEEDKESMFLWLRALCDTFPNLNIYDCRRHFLCYMYTEGYGCEQDLEKARQVIKNVPMVDGSVKNALVKYDHYTPDYKRGWMEPIVAYFLAEEWVEKGENLEQAKAWLTRVTTDSKWEKYRIAAQKLLDKLR